MSPTFFLRQFLVFLVLAWLTACSPSNTQRGADSRHPLSSMTLAALPDYIAKAHSEKPPISTEKLLLAAEFLLQEGELDWSREVLRSVNPAQMSNTHFARYSSLQGRLARKNGDLYLAKRYLFNDRLEELLPKLDIGQVAELREARATLLSDLSEVHGTISERVALSPLLEDSMQVQLNNDLIWEALMSIPFNELQTLSRTEKNAKLEAWYTLAGIAKDPNTSLVQQLQNVNKWVELWPQHDAAQNLPADLQLIRQLVNQQPRQVALLLPFSGRLSSAAEAIRDGFLAAYFSERQENGAVPKVMFYDTGTGDINALYESAVAEGADIVIGPLDKDALSIIAQRESLPVPTLGLNSLEAKPLPTPEPTSTSAANTATKVLTPKHNSLFTFSLSVESEARDVAERAWKDGHRRALILAPAGAWGDRAAQAFTEHWQTLEGSVVEEQRYSAQAGFSTMISSALGIDSSKQRQRELQQIIGEKTEFEPRRRADIDMIFLLAYGAQAQQIKPLLAFHYAADLEVYSTSQVFDGDTNTNMRDLNRIRFTTLPWFFGKDRSEKRAIDAYSKVKPGYQSLYAMGVDSYHIYPRLQQFAALKQARYYGETGKLSLSDNNEIVREQVWAEVRDGRIVPLRNLEKDAATLNP